jgi:ABC-type transporter Mla subunit MlaD
MSAPANRWKLGLFVLTGGALCLTALAWLGAAGMQRQKRIAWAYFDEALTGLEEGSPVRFRGVRIGVVDTIRIGRDKKHLAVQMSLFEEYLPELGLELDQALGGDPLATDLRAQVVMSWVTGTAFIQVDFYPDPGGEPQRLPFACAINTLRTVPSTAKSLEAAGREVLRDLPAIAAATLELVQLLQRELTAARLPAVMARLEAVLQALQGQIDLLASQQTVATVTEGFVAVGNTARSLQADQGPLHTALQEVAQLAASLRAELTRAELPMTTANLRDTAQGLANLGTDLQQDLASLPRTLASLQRLAELLERDPAALLRGRATPPNSPLLASPQQDHPR